MTPRPADEALHEPSELRRACLHEFAHLAVARHFGACGFVRIVRAAGSRTRYAGRFQMHGELADEEWRVVALAGTLAELLDGDAAIDAATVLARLVSGETALSPLDARLASGFDASDVARCLGIVRALWPVIEADTSERCNAEGDAAR